MFASHALKQNSTCEIGHRLLDTQVAMTLLPRRLGRPKQHALS